MKLILFASLLFFALSACDNVCGLATETIPNDEVSSSSRPYGDVACFVDDYIVEEEGSLTRTSLTPTEQGIQFSWSKGDYIGIFGSETQLLSFVVDRVDQDNAKLAYFKTDVFDIKANVVNYAISPYRSTDCPNYKAVPINYLGQRQLANNSSDHLGAFDYMTSSAISTEDNSAAFIFGHLSSIIRLNVTVPIAETFKSVTLRSSGEEFITTGELNLPVSLTNISSKTSSKFVTLALGEDSSAGLSLSKNEVLTAYLTVAPVDLRQTTITVILTTSSGSTYVSEVPGKKMEAGKAYNYNCGTVHKMTTIYTATDRHSESVRFQNLLRQACNFSGVPAPAVVLDGGDNVISTADSHMPAFSMQEVRDDVKAALNGVCDYKFLATFATHDSGCGRPTYNNYSVDPHYNENFYSGPQEQDGYYTYGITGSQMCETKEAVGDYVFWGHLQDYEYDYCQVADDAVSRFNTWVNSLPADDHRPIIVMSHIPMHMHRGDSYGGRIWLDALNAASEKHDIFFLWGHNHTIENNKANKKYDESQFVNHFLVPNDRITVQDKSTQSEVNSSPQKLHDYQGILLFHYMNAGYINWDKEGDTRGYSSIFTFIDDDDDTKYDRVVFRKFDQDGHYTKGTLADEPVNHLLLEPYQIVLTKQ